MEKVTQKISRATMDRFPVYLKALRSMQHAGKMNFLSSELAGATNIQDTTIRRDFSFLSKNTSLGKRGIGYDTKDVIDMLEEMLGLNLEEKIVLIGVGNLGSAILKYNRWQYTVGEIVLAYDKDVNKIGEQYGIKIQSLDELEKTFPKDCKIVILAISEDVQETVARLQNLGVKGIVDFTHTHFIVNNDVYVQSVDVVVAIQELVLKMKMNDNTGD